MKPSRKGDHGPEVLALQKKLIAAGHRLNPDSHFGSNTENALRAYQMKKGLIPDGIAGANTCKLLECSDKPNFALSSPMFNRLIALLGGTVMSAAIRAQHALTAPNQRSRHPVHLHTSEKGLKFIYTGEAQPGKSNVLHWPRGKSGVTLGPGYDMKKRTKLEIIADLQKVGVDKAAAGKVAEAAGLEGLQAEQFVKDNPGLVTLKDTDEFALLKRVVPTYEKRVRNVISVDLYQQQFDALVSVAYNLGSVPGTVASAINRGEIAKAMQIINTRYTRVGADEKDKGLIHRRGREVALFLYAKYGVLRSIA